MPTDQARPHSGGVLVELTSPRRARAHSVRTLPIHALTPARPASEPGGARIVTSRNGRRTVQYVPQRVVATGSRAPGGLALVGEGLGPAGTGWHGEVPPPRRPCAVPASKAVLAPVETVWEQQAARAALGRSERAAAAARRPANAVHSLGGAAVGRIQAKGYVRELEDKVALERLASAGLMARARAAEAAVEQLKAENDRLGRACEALEQELREQPVRRARPVSRELGPELGGPEGGPLGRGPSGELIFAPGHFSPRPSRSREGAAEGAGRGPASGPAGALVKRGARTDVVGDPSDGRSDGPSGGPWGGPSELTVGPLGGPSDGVPPSLIICPSENDRVIYPWTGLAERLDEALQRAGLDSVEVREAMSRVHAAVESTRAALMAQRYALNARLRAEGPTRLAASPTPAARPASPGVSSPPPTDEKINEQSTPPGPGTPGSRQGTVRWRGGGPPLRMEEVEPFDPAARERRPVGRMVGRQTSERALEYAGLA